MKNLYLLLFTLLACTLSRAQQPSSAAIVGLVTDSDGNPLVSSTLSLFQAGDSTLLKMEVTDDTGAFRFDGIPAGSYVVRGATVGQAAYQSAPVIVAESATANLGTIVFVPLMVELETAEVTAVPPMVTTLPDRMVVNVAQLLSATGGTVLNVLQQSPGVSASAQGGLSIRGKANVSVLIDGRPVHLDGMELTEYLQGMSADQLHQIEVITRPSAKYDAQGTGGVINLKTKQGMSNGFNGNFSISGHKGRTFNSVNNLDLNWKQNALNFHLNYGYTHAKPVIALTYNNVMRDGNGETESIENKTFLSESTNPTHNLRTGADYTLAKTKMGFTYQGNFKLYPDQNNESRSEIFFPQQSLRAVNTSTRKREARNPMQSANIYFNQDLNKTGASLSVVADYLGYNRPLTYFLDNDFTVSGQPELNEYLRIRQRIPSNIDIYGAKADLTYPISDNTTIETGVKSTLMKMDNDASFEIYDEASAVYVKDAQRSTHYLFDEHISAAYANLNQRFGEQWELQAGLRIENTRSDGKDVDRQQRFDRRRTQLFPSSSLTWQVSDNHSITASFARRTNRPNYEHLIPFSFYTDLLYYQKGNPTIAPEVDNNIQLSHIFAGKLTTTVEYSRLSDVMIWTHSREEGGQALVYGFGNLDRLDNYSISIDYADRFVPWYAIMAHVTGGYDRFQGMLEIEQMDSSRSFAFGQLLNQFRFEGGWGIQITGLAGTRYQDGPFAVADAYAQVDVTVAKQIFGNKGSIRLLAVDIFDSNWYNTYSQQRTLDSKSTQNGFQRQVGLSFSYRFGTDQGVRTKKPSASTEDEAGRL